MEKVLAGGNQSQNDGRKNAGRAADEYKQLNISDL